MVSMEESFLKKKRYLMDGKSLSIPWWMCVPIDTTAIVSLNMQKYRF